MKNQKGFTLIELLVVITILGIMAAIGLSSYRVANQKARDGRRAADIQQVRSALEMWRADCGAYPVTSSWTTLMGSGTFTCGSTNTNFVSVYLGNRAVNDPKGTAPYVYTYVGPAGGASYTITFTKELGGTETYLNP